MTRKTLKGSINPTASALQERKSKRRVALTPKDIVRILNLKEKDPQAFRLLLADKRKRVQPPQQAIPPKNIENSVNNEKNRAEQEKKITDLIGKYLGIEKGHSFCLSKEQKQLLKEAGYQGNGDGYVTKEVEVEVEAEGEKIRKKVQIDFFTSNDAFLTILWNGDKEKGETEARKRALNLINFIRAYTGKGSIDTEILNNENFKIKFHEELENTKGWNDTFSDETYPVEDGGKLFKRLRHMWVPTGRMMGDGDDYDNDTEIYLECLHPNGGKLVLTASKSVWRLYQQTKSTYSHVPLGLSSHPQNQ